MKYNHPIRRSLAILLATLITGAAISNETQKPEAIAVNEKAKRGAPRPVKPVEINNIRYEVVFRSAANASRQHGGMIAAFDAKTGNELWSLLVYSIEFDPHEERDVQEIYITKLIPGKDRNSLFVENAAHKSYSVDLTTRQVHEITGKREATA